MYTKILCAIDGSDASVKAAALAANLAKAFSSKLIYLHVTQPSHITEAIRRLAEAEHVVEPHLGVPQEIAQIPSWVSEAEQINSRASDDLRIAEYLGQRYLGNAERAAKEIGVADIDGMTEAGSPVEVILETANTLGVDAIVLGARGLSDLKGVFMGSVSHKVSHYAPCTCITVR